MNRLYFQPMRIVHVYDDFEVARVSEVARVFEVTRVFKVARVSRPVGAFRKPFHGSGDPCHLGCCYGPRCEMCGLVE